MDFELDQDQQMLAKTVSDFAKNESPVERFRKLRDDDIGYEAAVWQKMGELGWLGVAFPESVGGFGGSFVECALVLENLAATLVFPLGDGGVYWRTDYSFMDDHSTNVASADDLFDAMSSLAADAPLEVSLLRASEERTATIPA